MDKTVTSESAQAQWQDLLNLVAQGHRVTITVDGRAVATLGAPLHERADAIQAIEALRAERAGKNLGGIPIDQLRPEGRRW
jgi:antitoxin (DNA-binding transcriptional repressor) of toxin-antitoxin stability system